MPEQPSPADDRSERTPFPVISYATPEQQQTPASTMAIIALAAAWLFFPAVFLACGAIPRLGLTFLPVSLALVAIVLGWVSLRRPGNSPVDRNRGRTALIVGVIDAMLLLLVAIILPTTGRPREGANRIKCASNLKQIGLALQIYSQGNGNRYPPTLDEVLVDGDITSEVFCCPSGNDERAIGPTTQALLQDFHKPGHNSYVYVAGNQSDRTSTDTYVLAYEQPGNHANKGMNVLYGDGHVDWVPQAEATRVIAELQAGFNPPRSRTTQPSAR
jgi:prepilin-type processing-associated H-X9-DG protein